jgi:class 3 adenylate cyclase
MGLDEVGTVRILRERRTIIDALVAKHGDRIVKTTGDGVLLEFPLVDAVECAVAVQAVMAERNEGMPQERRMQFGSASTSVTSSSRVTTFSVTVSMSQQGLRASLNLATC